MGPQDQSSSSEMKHPELLTGAFREMLVKTVTTMTSLKMYMIKDLLRVHYKHTAVWQGDFFVPMIYNN